LVLRFCFLFLLLLGWFFLVGWWVICFWFWGCWVLGKQYVVFDPKQNRHVTSKTCGCPACRRKFGLLRKEEKEELRKEKRVKRLDRRFGVLQDIPLFCKVFPEGIVGDCGFRYFGFCAVFADGCVRWNELGDKKDYSVGLENPFEGGGSVG
jgi:hypothetical protein